MLHGQDFRRGHERHLAPGLEHARGGQQGHHGLARSHVALQQAEELALGLQAAADGPDRLLLAGRGGEGQGLPQPVLAGRRSRGQARPTLARSRFWAVRRRDRGSSSRTLSWRRRAGRSSMDCEPVQGAQHLGLGQEAQRQAMLLGHRIGEGEGLQGLQGDPLQQLVLQVGLGHFHGERIARQDGPLGGLALLQGLPFGMDELGLLPEGGHHAGHQQALAHPEAVAQELGPVEEDQVDGPGLVLDGHRHAVHGGGDGDAPWPGRCSPSPTFRAATWRSGAIDVAPGQVVDQVPQGADPGLGEDFLALGADAGKPGQVGHGGEKYYTCEHPRSGRPCLSPEESGA